MCKFKCKDDVVQCLKEMGIQECLPMMRKFRYGQIRGFFDRYNDTGMFFSLFGDSTSINHSFFGANSEFFIAQRCTLTNQDEYLFKNNKYIHT